MEDEAAFEPARSEADLGAVEARPTRRFAEARPTRRFPEPFEDDVDVSPSEDVRGRVSAAEVAARARTALKSKSEPLLDDSTPEAASAAANVSEDDVDEPSVVVGEPREPEEDTNEGRGGAEEDAVVETETSDASSSDASSSDVSSSDVSSDAFGLGDSATYVEAGSWAETAPHAVTLGGRPHAVMHLTLRDGDQLFASENMPWAEVLVNGARVRLPHQLSAGDVVSLRVRAESKAEIEAEEVAREEGKERVDPIRAATLRYGDVEGTLRTRVRDRAMYVAGYREARWDRSKAAFENQLAEDAARGAAEDARGAAEDARGAAEDAAANETNATETSGGDGHPGNGSAAVGITSTSGAVFAVDSVPASDPETSDFVWMSFALPGARGAASKVIRVTAPVPGQWMVIPPVDRPPVRVSGLGDGVANPVTVRFSDANDASESA